MSATVTPIDKPQGRPTVSTDIRAAAPKAHGLPSRKILLAGSLVLGALVVLAFQFGLSDKPRRYAPSEPQGDVHAATVPENVRAAPASYDTADLTGGDELEAPVDRLWGPAGPPPGYRSPTEPDPADYGAPPSNSNASGALPRDLDAEARDAARASPILFQNKRDAAASVGQDRDSPVHPARLQPPVSRTILQAGAVIPASLRTALNSDVPGRIIAQVTAPVHDSLTGEHLLIPQGARLIGAYQDAVTYGDRRIRIAWHRLILPNGWSIDLSGMEGTDVSGAAGAPARVDDHLDRVAVASILSGALSTAANAAQDRESSVFAQSVGDAAAQEAARVGGRIVDRELSVRPTLRVPAGAQVRVLISKDIVLRPYQP